MSRERAAVDVPVWLEVSDRAALFALATAFVERMRDVAPLGAESRDPLVYEDEPGAS
jgi:hypothetical protein